MISLGDFDKKLYILRGDKGILKVMKGSKEVLRCVKKPGLYSLEDEVVSGSTYFASLKPMSKIELLHMRLAHVSEMGLVKLRKYNMLGGAKSKRWSSANLVCSVNPA